MLTAVIIIFILAINHAVAKYLFDLKVVQNADRYHDERKPAPLQKYCLKFGIPNFKIFKFLYKNFMIKCVKHF